ncbi:MAG: dTMP kinase [Vicinamibacterales bacterium]
MQRGFLVAFEGLDQSGKATQAKEAARWLRARGTEVVTASFPDYGTPIGREIGLALRGERTFPPDVMQLLYVANRYEWRAKLAGALGRGAVVLCDRYVSSSVAYGEAQELDPSWLVDVQRHLPQPDLTLFLDIDPDTAVRRKATGRDRYERDLGLLVRVRESYRRQSLQPGWVRVNGEREVGEIAAEVRAILETRLWPQ